MKLLFIILLVVTLAIFTAIYVAASDRIDRTTVGEFDLKRYMGTWYEIARFDHRFERGMDAVRAHYELLPDGRVDVLNSGLCLDTGKRKQAHGKAHAGTLPGRLRVSFFWFFYSDYNVLELGQNYDWALVGSRSPRYLWILSRTPTLSHRTLNHILRRARERGYPIGNLRFVEHP